jgi:endonuclease/exonuclease/phosphatase family metal-dependent hydrolase
MKHKNDFELPPLNKPKELAFKVNPLELAHIYEFYSDHLPIGTQFNKGKQPFGVVTWNVLNKRYMKWIYKNEQGLKNTIITEFHEKKVTSFDTNINALTLREFGIFEHICHLVSCEKIDVLCMQEVSRDLLIAMREKLHGITPGHIYCSNGSSDENHEVTWIRGNHKVLETKIYKPYGEKETNSVLLTKIQQGDTDQIYMVLNSHVKWMSLDRFFEVCASVNEHIQSNEYVIPCGDFNSAPEDVQKALSKTKLSHTNTHGDKTITHIRAQNVPNKKKVVQFDFVLAPDNLDAIPISDDDLKITDVVDTLKRIQECEHPISVSE